MGAKPSQMMARYPVYMSANDKVEVDEAVRHGENCLHTAKGDIPLRGADYMSRTPTQGEIDALKAWFVKH